MTTVPLKDYPQFSVINHTPQIQAIMTILRDRTTKRSDFVFFSDRLFRLLMEEGLACLDFNKKEILTPTGSKFEVCERLLFYNSDSFPQGLDNPQNICGVSVVRAGESMETALRQIVPNVRIGKILIQRAEDGTALPHLFYTKLPKDIVVCQVLLLDPMLATGGSAICAVDELVRSGVPEERIIFLNMIAAPEGVAALLKVHPKIKIVSCALDDSLNDQKYIIPGIGDFGDRYFGTV